MGSKKPPSRLSVLSQRSDFLYILKNGQRLRPTPWLLLNYVESPTGNLRCGWTLPRQVGPAVIRNRLKRWSRVYFRSLLKAGKTLPVDLNLVFRKTEGDFYKKLSYERFASVMDKGLSDLVRRRKTIAANSSSRPSEARAQKGESKSDAKSNAKT